MKIGGDPVNNLRAIYLRAVENRAAIYLMFVIITVGLFPSKYLMEIVALWVAVGIIGIVIIGTEILYVKKHFPGNVLAFYRSPGPIDSLIDSLETNGVPLNSVKTISLESADLQASIDYYTNSRQRLLKALKAIPDMRLNVYGPCKNAMPKPLTENTELICIDKELTRHVNLIETKDRSFVWYEPFHDVINGKHYFTRGAYLIEIDNSLVPQIKKEYDELPRCMA
jgi:hypothetical protein